MRVAVFTETYHQLNGVGRTYQNMVKYASKKGLDLDIYVPGDGSVESYGSANVFNVEVEAGIEYYPTLIYDAAAVPRFLFNMLPEIIKRNFSEKEYDIAQIGTPGSIGLYALLASRQFDVPLVGSYHTQVPNYAKYRVDMALKRPEGPLNLVPEIAMEASWIGERAFFGKTVFNMAPTQMVSNEIEERFQRPTRVFRRGIDTERFHPGNGKRPEKPTVLFVSRLAVEKNIDMLVGFGKHLPYADLIVVGDGPDRERMEGLIPEGNYRGFLTGRDLDEAYTSAHAFVFPSVTETYGNVVQEAMASGLPVVVDGSCPTAELIEDNVTGLHYKDQKDMFSKLDMLLKNGNINRKMSLNARSEMERRTWDAVFDSVYDGYNLAKKLHSERNRSLGYRFRTRIEELFKPDPTPVLQQI